MSKSFLLEYHTSSTKCSFCTYVKLIIVYSGKLYLKCLFLKKNLDRKKKEEVLYTCQFHTLFIHAHNSFIQNHKELSHTVSLFRSSCAVEPLQYTRMHDWACVCPQGAIQTSAANTTMNGPYAFSWVKRSHVLFSRRQHVALQLTGRESLTCILNTSIFFWSCMWVSCSPKW